MPGSLFTRGRAGGSWGNHAWPAACFISYTKETHRAQLGALELTVKDRETVNIPVWLGVGALVAGGLMLVVPERKI